MYMLMHGFALFGKQASKHEQSYFSATFRFSYLCMSPHVYVPTCTCPYMYMYMSLHVHVYVLTCTCPYKVYVHVPTCTYTCACPYMYMSLHVHVPTCTCPYMYMFLHVHVPTCVIGLSPFHNRAASTPATLPA